MALEIARVIPANSRVLDIGCGSGFIAHHLSSMIGTPVSGVDLDAQTEAAIDYRQFDGKHFPIADGVVNAALLCYVLHHAQDLGTVLGELRRVLARGGLAVVYEDIPSAAWDRLVCWIHDFKWRRRTGRCSFRNPHEWRVQFKTAGFEVLQERTLSRCRNLAHPVSRRLFILRKRPHWQ